MDSIFLKLFNMSVTATWLALAVILLRPLLKKAPRWITVAMWALVGVRLICPISFESMLSLVPSAETVPQDIVYAQTPEINSGVYVINSVVNPIMSESFTPTPGASVNPIQIFLFLAEIIWIAGMVGMLIYTAFSYLLLHRKVREAAPYNDNVWLCDRISSPFILGVIRPRIYLPSDMAEADVEYVLAHERAHLTRRDHWWKPLGFLLLTVYWFNPVLWIAYILLCRDIELACDEKVIAKLGTEIKKPYSDALINCSVPRRSIAACPLAFGEVGVKTRIKSVLNYKKPAFWVIVVALVLCVALAVGFLTDPVTNAGDESITVGMTVTGKGSELEGVSAAITGTMLGGESPYLALTWSNSRADDIMYGEEFYVYRLVDGEWVDCRTSDPFVWHNVGYFCLAGGTSTYEYNLSNIDVSRVGKYRFETECHIIGGDTTEYLVWVEFELTQDFFDNPQFDNPQFDDEIVYTPDDGYFDSVPSVTDNLRQKYPEYFGLDTSKGLEVYWYQMAAGSYSWVILPGRDEAYTWQDIIGKISTTIGEMRAIVDYYDLPRNKVSVKHLGVPHSSYLVPDSQEYYGEVEEMFWSTLPTGVSVIPTYGSLVFDIDKDGAQEIVTLGYGLTSGVFSFSISASYNGEQKYMDYFIAPHSAPQFLVRGVDDVCLVLKAQAEKGKPEVSVVYEISVVDGHIILTPEEDSEDPFEITHLPMFTYERQKINNGNS